MKTWADTLRAARNPTAAAVAMSAAERLSQGTVEATLEWLRKSEATLAASLPALVR